MLCGGGGVGGGGGGGSGSHLFMCICDSLSSDPAISQSFVFTRLVVNA